MIERLILKTHLLEETRAFYCDTLGLSLLDSTPSLAAFQAGSTRLEFERVEDGSEPWYHFAFNIPENKILQARDWQLQRSPLMPIPERMQANAYPAGVVDFSHWNAHSIYFFDPAGNVVEYIARHDLHNASQGPFTPKDILCVCEIGLIVEDVLSEADRVKAFSGLGQYRGGDEQFTAIGDEHGLLLLMKRGRHLDFKDPSEKLAGIFPTQVTIQREGGGSYRFTNEPHEISRD